MPRFRIRMINSEFESVEETDYPSFGAARQSAITTATKVAAEAIAAGSENSAIELQISQDEIIVARHVVKLSVADLLAGDEAAA